jgi:hypothetical protein
VHAVSYMRWSRNRKRNRSPNRRDKGPTNRLSNCCSISIDTWRCSCQLRRLLRGLPRICGLPICLTCDWTLSSISIVHAGDVMYTWSPPLSVHWVQADKILLCVTSYLSRRPWDHKVPRDAPPVTFAILFKSKKKQSAKTNSS